MTENQRYYIVPRQADGTPLLVDPATITKWGRPFGDAPTGTTFFFDPSSGKVFSPIAMINGAQQIVAFKELPRVDENILAVIGPYERNRIDRSENTAIQIKDSYGFFEFEVRDAAIYGSMTEEVFGKLVLFWTRHFEIEFPMTAVPERLTRPPAPRGAADAAL